MPLQGFRILFTFGHSSRTDDMPEAFHLLLEEVVFRGLQASPVLLRQVENLLQLDRLLLWGARKDDYVILVDQTGLPFHSRLDNIHSFAGM